MPDFIFADFITSKFDPQLVNMQVNIKISKISAFLKETTHVDKKKTLARQFSMGKKNPKLRKCIQELTG